MRIENVYHFCFISLLFLFLNWFNDTHNDLRACVKFTVSISAMRDCAELSASVPFTTMEQERIL